MMIVWVGVMGMARITLGHGKKKIALAHQPDQ